MSKTVIKKGHADWADLKGKKIAFDWTDGYDVFYETMEFSHTQISVIDPRYPRYFIFDESGRRYCVDEDGEVKVTILD